MLEIKIFQCNMLAENCYVVSDDSGEAVIIDCGALYADERQAIGKYIADQQLTPVRLLCTHGHLDHCFGLAFVHARYGLSPQISTADDFLLSDLSGQASTMFGMDFAEPTPPLGPSLEADVPICFGHHTLHVLPTPGHSPGSVLFYCKEERVVFTGDTLFRMGIGRTDLQRGSWADMKHSLANVVAKLPADTLAYCGHGPATRLGDEQRLNPYLR